MQQNKQSHISNQSAVQNIISRYCVLTLLHPNAMVRFIVYSITLLSNRFPTTPHSDVARFLKSCCLVRHCLWLCTLTKFGLG